jgi:hypothetical protein
MLTGTRQMNLPGQSRIGIGDALKKWLYIWGAFLWGLGWAATFALVLLVQRAPHSQWRGLLLVVSGTWIICQLYRSFPSLPTGEETVSDRGDLLGLALSGCFVVLYPMRNHVWAPWATGVLCGAYFWAYYRRNGQSYSTLPAGCVVAVVIAVQLAWPNEQRCLLVFVGAGLTVSIQAAWNIYRYLEGKRTAPATA